MCRLPLRVARWDFDLSRRTKWKCQGRVLVYTQKCAGSLAGSAGEAWLWGADAPGPLGTHSHALPQKPNRAQQTKHKAAKPRGLGVPPGGGLASGEDLVPAGLLWGSGLASAFLPPRRQGCASSVCELRGSALPPRSASCLAKCPVCALLLGTVTGLSEGFLTKLNTSGIFCLQFGRSWGWRWLAARLLLKQTYQFFFPLLPEHFL